MSDLNLEDKLCKNLEDSCIKAYKFGQQSMQAEINQHQLEVHSLGEANLNQAMMLAKKQEEIDSLKAQLNNMEACYIQKKKEVEGQQGRVSKALNFINNWWHPDLDQKLFVEAVAKALRGEHD